VQFHLQSSLNQALPDLAEVITYSMPSRLKNIESMTSGYGATFTRGSKVSSHVIAAEMLAVYVVLLDRFA